MWTLCEVPVGKVSGGEGALPAFAGRDGLIRRWDLQGPREVRAFTSGTGPVFALCRADVGGRTLLVAGGDGPAPPSGTPPPANAPPPWARTWPV
ncbi:hypothetical protein [Streptomyces antibioticus]|uniref:hypothetical protein n=1 Tax=Streptomyces antibioticus TaxID=1890 RepID=UPI0033DDA726